MKMRIGLTTPTTLEEVPRGGERFFHELATWLAARGNDVTLISSKQGPTEIQNRNGYTSVRYRRPWHPSLARAGVLPFHAFFFNCLPALLRHRFDVVQSCTFMDTWAATLARRLTGAPCVFWFNSVPPPVNYVRSITLRGAVFRRAMRDVDEVIALSNYVSGYTQTRFGRPGVILPIPVDTEQFVCQEGKRSRPPVILCAASLADQRKGVRLLMRAFDLIKRGGSPAMLELASPVTPALEAELLALIEPRWRGEVRFLGESGERLPDLYASASVSVLPSLWEAFGMVVLESMATGTPVVGARDGALPELIPNDSVGRLFDPGPTVEAAASNVDGLARALLDALDLARDPRTAQRCRAHADRYSWSEVGPRFEALYREVIARRARAGRERRA
jgi:phosphatidylinositol alpha-mannosyltransferase